MKTKNIAVLDAETGTVYLWKNIKTRNTERWVSKKHHSNVEWMEFVCVKANESLKQQSAMSKLWAKVCRQ